METYQILGSVFTVLSFAVFMGILLWTFSSRRKEGFDRASLEPFALPDEDKSSSADERGGLVR